MREKEKSEFFKFLVPVKKHVPQIINSSFGLSLIRQKQILLRAGMWLMSVYSTVDEQLAR